MIIDFEKIRTPQAVFIIYMFVSSLLIMLFRFIFPGLEIPIILYSRNWRLVQGLLELFNLFPALALSAIMIPFGIYSLDENYKSFSDVFFKRLIVSVVIAIVASVIYCIIFFLAFPIVKNSEENMRFKGELYQLAKIHTQEKKTAGEWREASQFLSVCDRIWPNSPELADLRVDIEINLNLIYSREIEEKYFAREALARDWRGADVSVLSGNQQPISAVQAISMSRAAYNEKRYFDSHWLAVLAGRLAESGSLEAANAARLAGEAWNMIASLAPNQMEERLFSLYSLKLSGYQAMNTGDWIRAFYIFQELLAHTPDDPDAKNFLAASERGAGETAFFTDEIEHSLGEILTGAFFSLPNNDGRSVLRFSSLTTSGDAAYGMGFEYMAFDINSRPVISARSRYAKILPFMLNKEPHVLILTHAIDRYDEKNYYDSEWLIGDKTPGGILLNISYEDLLLLSNIRRGLPNLQMNDLFTAFEKSSDAGYVYQIFQAEILNRLSTVLFFMPVAIIVIVFGWRYRIKSKPRYIFVLMLLILPVVFNALVFLYRSMFNVLGIWLVLSAGFVPAVILYIAVMAISLFISLIILSAQHS